MFVRLNLFSFMTVKLFNIEIKCDVARQHSFQSLHLTAGIEVFDLYLSREDIQRPFLHQPFYNYTIPNLRAAPS